MATPPEYGQTQATVPVCYRHPGRQTYVSCVRCGRPACPDCLRPAAVGHQCVDCIRQGNQGARRATGRFGGRVTGGARVTWCLMGLNIGLYLVLLAHPSLQYDWWMIGGAQQNGQVVGVAVGQWYRLLTSAFLPGTGSLGILDIAFNMWALYIVGPAMERMLGPVRYLAVYLASALGGGVAYYFLAPVNQPALGASGAIFGLLGAAVVEVRRRRRGVMESGIGALIVLNLAFSFWFPNISIGAHIGGLIGGFLAALAIRSADDRRVPLLHRRVPALGFLGCFLLSAVAVAGSIALAGTTSPGIV